MVKISTLNKYKRKKVFVRYHDENEGCDKDCEGILSDVESKYITIEYDNAESKGFVKIPIDDINKLSMKRHQDTTKN